MQYLRRQRRARVYHPSEKLGRVPGLNMKILKIPSGLLEVFNEKKLRQYNGQKKRKQRQNMVHKTPHRKLKIDAT